MKTLLTVIICISSISGMSQKIVYADLKALFEFDSTRQEFIDTAYRRIKVGVDSFLVRYEYNADSWMDTSVGRMIMDSTGNMVEDTQGYIDNRHYNARVTVFKILNVKDTKIGEPILGKYVPATCFEDNPTSYVLKATGLTNGTKK